MRVVIRTQPFFFVMMAMRALHHSMANTMLNPKKVSSGGKQSKIELVDRLMTQGMRCSSSCCQMPCYNKAAVLDERPLNMVLHHTVSL